MPLTLSLGLFCLDREVLAEDGVDLARHEGPRRVGVGQRALVPARAVDLGSGALPLDAVSRAGEAELVMLHGRALDEVGVLQPLLAEGALEGGVSGCSAC